MEKSTVYFTDFRCPVGTSQLDKLKKLCIAAGIHTIDMEGKFVAIKMHFGELGNMAFLRPNYAKVVADLCKELPDLHYPGPVRHRMAFPAHCHCPRTVFPGLRCCFPTAAAYCRPTVSPALHCCLSSHCHCCCLHFLQAAPELAPVVFDPLTMYQAPQ